MRTFGFFFVGLAIILVFVALAENSKSKASPTNNKKQSITAIDTNNVESKVENFVGTKVIDSSRIERLKPLFRVKKDEFEQSKWYYPKSAPKYVNYNAAYCYFETDVNNFAYNLRLELQYSADDWLFIRNCVFLIDGNTYRLIPDDVKRDNGEGGIWEWMYIQVTGDAVDIVNALVNAKSAKIKYNGQEYYHITNLTSEQLKSIRQTVELYKAMGGTL